MIRGVAFDLEGTVIDVEAAHHGAHLRAMAEMGIEMTLEEALVRIPHFIGGPHECIRDEVWALSDGTKPPNFFDERDRFWYDKLLKTMPITPRPGWRWCFGEILARGLHVSIGSLTRKDQAQHLLARSGLDRLFKPKTIVLHDDVQHLKPAPDVFLETARRMGIDPKDQLVFEDSPNGVRAAIAAGSKAVGMPVVIRGSTVGALVDAGASRIFFDWREINILALIENLS